METICAISTPAGIGGIAVIRISGPEAIAATNSLWQGKSLEDARDHTAHLGTITDPATGQPIDQAVATIFRAPRSFTGDDTVELSVHGSRWIQAETLRLLCDIPGVRLAKPGEFTRRAFANGRIDLAQAEAVADVIAAQSRAAARIAQSQLRGRFSGRLADLRSRLLELASLLELELDFGEEHVEFASRPKLLDLATEIFDELTRLHKSFQAGQAIKDGIPTAIIGPTNAGKSSLLNALLGDDRAIVSDIHGTTRDIVEDTLTIGDHQLRLMDTAGLRHTSDPIEAIGINRSVDASRRATLLLIVVDASQPQSIADIIAPLGPNAQLPDATIVVLNKTDIAEPPAINLLPLPDSTPVIPVSATTGQGIDTLRTTIAQTLADTLNAPADTDIIITNQRHATALAQAADATARAISALEAEIPADLVAQELRQTIHHLGEITGAITTPEILTTIFTHFCIGK